MQWKIICRVGLILFATAFQCAIAGPIARSYLVKWTDRRVREFKQLTRDRKIDQIGWVTGIERAKELAAMHQRPVYLFTHSGRIQLGRC